MNLAFGAPGPFEILLILFVVLLLFGAKKLPELSRSLGRSLGEFKKGREEGLKPEPDPPEKLAASNGDEEREPAGAAENK